MSPPAWSQEAGLSRSTLTLPPEPGNTPQFGEDLVTLEGWDSDDARADLERLAELGLLIEEAIDTYELPLTPELPELTPVQRQYRTESRLRAPRVPHGGVPSGVQGGRDGNIEGVPSGNRSEGTVAAGIPKLTVRVRFPSSAPCKRPCRSPSGLFDFMC